MGRVLVRMVLCQQIHEGESSVSPKMQAECLGLGCENRGTCACVSEEGRDREGEGEGGDTSNVP